MKSSTKHPRAKDARVPIHLSSFGRVNALYFDKGGYARVQMNTVEIGRLIEALQRYALRKPRIPDPKVLAALDTLHQFFSVVGKGYDITVTADMVLAGYGVSLEPILKELI
jgi:hypothetical protein